MALVTVIVPVYKVQDYLERCINSILSQTFSDFELILVDDGSPDSCPTLCDEFEKKDSRVHVIHRQNAGLSAARNTGIEWAFAHSDSQWLCFIDSDDWVHPRYLECLVAAAYKHKTKIALCEFQEVSTNFVEEKLLPLVVSQQKNAMDFYLQNVRMTTVAWNKLYSKELFVDCRYPIGKKYEDAFVSYRLMYKVREFAFVKAPLYYYFQREGSIIRSAYSIHNLDAIEAIQGQCKFFEERDVAVYRMCAKRYLDRYSSNWHQVQAFRDKEKYMVLLSGGLLQTYKKCMQEIRPSLRERRDLHEIIHPGMVFVLRILELPLRLIKKVGHMFKDKS